MPFKLIVAGSDLQVKGLKSIMEEIIKERLKTIHKKHNNDIEIVCTGYGLISDLAQRFAKDNHYGLKICEPKHDIYKRAAIYNRDEDMVLYGDLMQLFWNGRTDECKRLIKFASQYKVPVFIKRFEPENQSA